MAAFGIAALALAAAACEESKSSNPLSPSVAGPIPGVEIGTPKTLEPTGGAKIAADKQPVTLLIENAGSTGVRPISYMFEVATDAAYERIEKLRRRAASTSTTTWPLFGPTCSVRVSAEAPRVARSSCAVSVARVQNTPPSG